MRAVVGILASAQVILYLVHDSNRTFAILSACLLLAGCGACLLIGFLTPVVSIGIAILSVAMRFSMVPIFGRNASNGGLALFELIVMTVAIALLGPGAFSLDARLFGYREIVIPPSSRTPES